jgi:hypothetical protein
MLKIVHYRSFLPLTGRAMAEGSRDDVDSVQALKRYKGKGQNASKRIQPVLGDGHRFHIRRPDDC